MIDSELDLSDSLWRGSSPSKGAREPRVFDKKVGRGGDEEVREEEEDDDRELPSVEMLGADEERCVFPLREANDCRIFLGSDEDDEDEKEDEEMEEEWRSALLDRAKLRSVRFWEEGEIE